VRVKGEGKEERVRKSGVNGGSRRKEMREGGEG
jgi:hypothetical protein